MLGVWLTISQCLVALRLWLFPTYSRVAPIDFRVQLARVQGLANLTSVLFVHGMRLEWFACGPGKIEAELSPDIDLWSVICLYGFI